MVFMTFMKIVTQWSIYPLRFLPFTTDPCPFGNIYDFVGDVSIGPLTHRFALQLSYPTARGHEKWTFLSRHFRSKLIMTLLWLYTGLASDRYNPVYPGFDDARPPDTFKTYTEPNFWLEIYTDRNIVSHGFTISISAGKNQLSTNQFN